MNRAKKSTRLLQQVKKTLPNGLKIDPFKNNDLIMRTIHRIFKYDSLETFKYLELYENERNSLYNFSLAYYACKYNSIKLLKYLDSKEVNIFYDEKQYCYEQDLMRVACAACNFDVIKYLLSKGVVDINHRINNETTYLLITFADSDKKISHKKHLKILKYLVDQGADIHAQNKYDYNALFYACIKGNLKIIKYLLKQGVELTEHRVVICHKKTLMYFHKKGLVNIYQTNPKNETLLFDAVCYGHVNVVKYLVEKCGFDIHHKNNEGVDLLEHICCNVGLYEPHIVPIVRYLLKKGIDIYYHRDNQIMWAKYASQRCYLDIMYCVLEHDINIYKYFYDCEKINEKLDIKIEQAKKNDLEIKKILNKYVHSDISDIIIDLKNIYEKNDIILKKYNRYV